MNKDERITYEEFMIMFKNAPRMAYVLYDKAEDEIDKYKNVIDKIKEKINENRYGNGELCLDNQETIKLLELLEEVE